MDNDVTGYDLPQETEAATSPHSLASLVDLSRRLREQGQELDEARSTAEDLRIDNKRLQELIYQLQESHEKVVAESHLQDSLATDALAQSQVIAVLRTELTTALTEGEQRQYEARMAARELEEFKKRQAFLTSAHERLHTECEGLRKSYEEVLTRLDEKEALLSNAREKLRESSAALAKTQIESRENRRRSQIPPNFSSAGPFVSEEPTSSGLKALRLGASSTANDDASEPLSSAAYKLTRRVPVESINEEGDMMSLRPVRPQSPTLSSISAQSAPYGAGLMRSRSQDIPNGTIDHFSSKDAIDTGSISMSRKDSNVSEMATLKRQLAESEESRKAGEVCMKALREQISLLNEKLASGESATETLKLPPLPSEADDEDASAHSESDGKLASIKSWKLPFGNTGTGGRGARNSVSSTTAPSLVSNSRPSRTHTSSVTSTDSIEPSTTSSPFATVSQFFGRSSAPLPPTRSFSNLSGTTDDLEEPRFSPTLAGTMGSTARSSWAKPEEDPTQVAVSPTSSTPHKSPSVRSVGPQRPVVARVGSWFASRSLAATEIPKTLEPGEFDEVGL